MYTLMDFFSGDYISALRGCCALNCLHTLEIDHGLIAHTRRWTGFPPPKKSWKLKIWLKIQRAGVHNFRDNGRILTKLFMRPAITARGISSSWIDFALGLAAPSGLTSVGLCHALIVFFVSPRVLKAPSTDRPETLPHGRNLTEFYKLTSKIRGAAPIKLGGGQKHAKFR